MKECLGAVLYQNRSDEALKISKDIIGRCPENAESRYFLSVAFRQKKNFEEAENYLRDYLKRVPNSAPAYEDLCEVLLEQGPEKLEEARLVAREARNKGLDVSAKLEAKLGL